MSPLGSKKVMEGGDSMLSSHTVASIISHLGGEDVLARIGARDLFTYDTHVSFELHHWNPKGVRSVVISTEPHGFFAMDCYGPIIPSSMKAQLVGKERKILPENLAMVLGQLTGIESNRHF